MEINQQLSDALELHQSGDLLGAGEIYGSILKEEPDNIDALNLLGVVMQAAGDLDLAAELISRATELAPDYFAPFANLGNVYQASEKYDKAISAFQTALRLNPESPETLNNLASVLNIIGRFQEAYVLSEQALGLITDFSAAKINRGNALLGLGQPDQAIECYREVVKQDPTAGDCWYNLGNAYADLFQWEDACGSYQKALKFDSENPVKHYNFANALQELNRFDEAISSFHRALMLKPDYIDAQCNLASALQSTGQTKEAISNLEEALLDEPESADLHWNLALALLQVGNYVKGWQEYEWRWKTPKFAGMKSNRRKPHWDGSSLEGKTIFLTAEQGFGDAIMFCRYAPKIVEQGARVILECRPQLMSLFSTLNGVSQCIELGTPFDNYDVQASLMSLPAIMLTTLETIPSKVPYLSLPEYPTVDHRLVSPKGLKVGIVWAGSPSKDRNNKFSCSLQDFMPLFNHTNIVFFCLQVGEAQKQINDVDVPDNLIDIADTLNDFGDTAIAVACMDLIISVDTAVLHLAGALGKPAWGLMSQPTGYLWMDEREDSEWYPSIKLFRQSEPGDWNSVFKAVEDELSTFK